MYDCFLVLIDSICMSESPFAPSVPPTVEINGIAAYVFAHKDTVAVVGAVKRCACRHPVLHSVPSPFEGGDGGGLAGYEQAAYYRIFPDRWFHVVSVL